jgi:hypothetical protein
MRLTDAGRLPRSIFHPVQIGCELAFYEKVVKVKADVAAILITKLLIPSEMHKPSAAGDLGSCQGRPRRGRLS